MLDVLAGCGVKCWNELMTYNKVPQLAKMSVELQSEESSHGMKSIGKLEDRL